MNTFSFHNDILYAESVAIKDLLNIYGSPIYIYSKNEIKNNWQKFNNAFGKHKHLICYAVKANSNLAVLNIMAKMGSGFDILSIGELKRVIAAGGDSKKCVFSGIAKTHLDIQQALEYGIYCFNIESESEMYRIEEVAKSMNVKADISIRINPDVNAKTHPYISTGLKENKFGVDTDLAKKMYFMADKSKYLNICGLDFHIGSQITEISPLLESLDKALILIADLNKKGIEIKHIDVGGGIGIKYQDEKTIDIKYYIDSILKKVKNMTVLLEPGRSIVGNAGIFVTKVEYLKQNSKKSFAIIDGAMNDLLRPSLYNAYHRVLPIEKKSSGIKAKWNLVGPVCETGDFLAKDRELNIAQGDYIALMSAGAYGFVMSSNYNSRPRVAEVMVFGDKHKLVRKRESIDNLFTNEYIL